ncbi:MAG: type IV secretion system DNA-binding domain-containing protein [Chloroflexi bacterium]|nr:type IV secretion system DNA-binding domain-containing protein [Chloroflexota bacterium]
MTSAKVSVQSFAHPHYPMFGGEFIVQKHPADSMGDASRQHPVDSAFLLSVDELAALWHLPYEGFAASSIGWGNGREIKAPQPILRSQEGVCLGHNHYAGQDRPVYIHPEDRTTHIVSFGKAGTGKSTLLHHLIHQDIAAGQGVAVVDPHGKLIDDILAASIPDNRLDDVVLLECGRMDTPVPLNPLRIAEGVSEETAYNYLYWVLQKIYERIWLEGQTDRVIQNVLRTLLCDPEATPLDIQRILTNGSYRAQMIAKLKERRMRTSVLFWDEYNQMSTSLQLQVARPVLSRTEAFLGRRAVERMTCHRGTLNLQSYIANKKIVLINLAGEAIQTEVDSLGAMFLAGFYMAFHALGYLPDGSTPRYYLYIDEVERFVTSPIQNMFSEARKLGLSLTLANQYLDQLSQETLNSILGNEGTLIAFECGDRDARALASKFAPELDQRALQNLGKYNIAVKTRVGADTLPAFTVQTRSPLEKIAGVDVNAIRERSAQQNRFLTADEVDDWLDRRYFSNNGTPPEPEEAPPSTDGLGDYE